MTDRKHDNKPKNVGQASMVMSTEPTVEEVPDDDDAAADVTVLGKGVVVHSHPSAPANAVALPSMPTQAPNSPTAEAEIFRRNRRDAAAAAAAAASVVLHNPLVSAVGGVSGRGRGGGGGSGDGIHPLRATQAAALVASGSVEPDFVQTLVHTPVPLKGAPVPKGDPRLSIVSKHQQAREARALTTKDQKAANELLTALRLSGDDKGAISTVFNLAGMREALPDDGGIGAELIRKGLNEQFDIPFEEIQNRYIFTNVSPGVAIARSLRVTFGTPIAHTNTFDDLVECQIGHETIAPIVVAVPKNCSAIYGSQGKVTEHSAKAFVDSFKKYGDSVMTWTPVQMYAKQITRDSTEEEVGYIFLSLEQVKPIFQPGITDNQFDLLRQACMRSTRDTPGLEHSIKIVNATNLTGEISQITVIEAHSLMVLAAFTLNEAYLGRNLHQAHRDGIENSKKSGGHLHIAVSLLRSFYHIFPMMIRKVQEHRLAEWKQLLLSSVPSASPSLPFSASAATTAAAAAPATTAAPANVGSNEDPRAEIARLRDENIRLRHALGQAQNADAKMREQLDALSKKYATATAIVHHVSHFTVTAKTIVNAKNVEEKQKLASVNGQLSACYDSIVKGGLANILEDVLRVCKQTSHGNASCNAGKMFVEYQKYLKNQQNIEAMKARGATAAAASASSVPNPIPAFAQNPGK